MLRPDLPTNTKAIASWCFYDWANSAFTTLVVTFIYSAYFADAFADDPGRGAALWSRGIMISAFLIAVLAPIAGAMSDRGDRWRYLVVCTAVCVIMSVALTFVRPSQPNAVLLALSFFIVANVAFELGMVFYNAFLPTIVTADRIGRVSGYGWGLGYAGGLGALLVALLILVPEVPLFGISTVDGFNLRATNLLAAGWFLVFSFPALIFLKDDQATRQPLSIGKAFTDLATTFRCLRRYREVCIFLLARLFYNDGLVTIFAFGGIYAVGTFGFTFEELVLFGIVINVGAGVGSFALGFFDDKVGSKTTIQISIVALVAATTLAAVAQGRMLFWASSMLLGIFVGPNQSASRSLMARFVPKTHESEFFGLFAFSGKVTSFMGPALFGVLSDAYSQRIGVMSVLLFFVIGGVLLWWVDEQSGIVAADQ